MITAQPSSSFSSQATAKMGPTTVYKTLKDYLPAKTEKEEKSKSKEISDNANIYAVVADATYPFFANGKYITTLKIIDQSHHSVGDDKVEGKATYNHSVVIVFSSRFEDSPRVARVGDVIRLTKAKAKEFNGLTQYHVDLSAGSNWVLFSPT